MFVKRWKLVVNILRMTGTRYVEPEGKVKVRTGRMDAFPSVVYIEKLPMEKIPSV